MNASPFHSGEQRAQERMGVREMIEPWARQVIRPFMPDQHREFFANLPYIVLAARDAAGQPWATLLAEAPGFVQTPDDRRIDIAAALDPGDALVGNLNPGTDIALLGIELVSRRRNRANGILHAFTDSGLSIALTQSFGNCPQYIHPRAWQHVPRSGTASGAVQSNTLDQHMQNLIGTADTFFIASGHRPVDGVIAPDPLVEGATATYGMDVSHRGGQRGFVRVLSDHELVFPDYAGNNHYNTVGNLLEDPRAGLLFVDFDSGDLLQITGRARIDWDSGQHRDYPGAERLIYLNVQSAVRLEGRVAGQFSDAGDAIRSLRVVARTQETDDVISLELAARDGGVLPAFAPGQHLPLQLLADGELVQRTYSLSGDPAASNYRISVRKQRSGRVSRALHDSIQPGDLLNAHAPGGDFVLQASTKPIVLVGAGIGITPLLSMLYAWSGDTSAPPIYVFHGNRDQSSHPHRKELISVTRNNADGHLVFAYSQTMSEPQDGATLYSGRINLALMQSQLPTLDCEYYLCGPVGFLADISAGLVTAGVAQARIHVEDFGAY